MSTLIAILLLAHFHLFGAVFVILLALFLLGLCAFIIYLPIAGLNTLWWKLRGPMPPPETYVEFLARRPDLRYAPDYGVTTFNRESRERRERRWI
jgi:hypothetical protein